MISLTRYCLVCSSTCPWAEPPFIFILRITAVLWFCWLTFASVDLKTTHTKTYLIGFSHNMSSENQFKPTPRPGPRKDSIHPEPAGVDHSYLSLSHCLWPQGWGWTCFLPEISARKVHNGSDYLGKSSFSVLLEFSPGTDSRQLLGQESGVGARDLRWCLVGCRFSDAGKF